MIFACSEFQYTQAAVGIPAWLSDLPGEVKHFDMMLVERPPNERLVMVVAMYEPADPYYTYTVPVDDMKEEVDSMKFAVKSFSAGADQDIQNWLNKLPGRVVSVWTDTYEIAGGIPMISVSAIYKPGPEPLTD